MQGKGAITFLAILIGLACVFQLSFTAATAIQESKAAKAAAEAKARADAAAKAKADDSIEITVTYVPKGAKYTGDKKAKKSVGIKSTNPFIRWFQENKKLVIKFHAAIEGSDGGNDLILNGVGE